MASLISNLSSQFFKFRVAGETWTIPVTPVENSDSLNFSSNWSTVNVQGSTEAMSAFNYVNNPTLPINLKFHEDLWREYNLSHTYEETIAKLASLQYPGAQYNQDSSTIEAPYIFISYKGYTFRGYFTSMRITESGPIRNGHNVLCEISAQFTIVKSTSPTREGVASMLKTTFQ